MKKLLVFILAVVLSAMAVLSALALELSRQDIADILIEACNSQEENLGFYAEFDDVNNMFMAVLSLDDDGFLGWSLLEEGRESISESVAAACASFQAVFDTAGYSDVGVLLLLLDPDGNVLAGWSRDGEALSDQLIDILND